MRKMINIIKWILIISAVLGVVLIRLGFISGGEFKDFALNLGTELIGIFLTVLAIEYIYRREEKKREQQRKKRRLIINLVTGSRQRVEEALDELRDEEWLFDGSIFNKKFENRDFSELDFRHARFVNCSFHEVNFNGAKLQSAIFKGEEKNGNVSFEKSEMDSVNLDGFSFPGELQPSIKLQHSILRKALSLRLAIMPDGKKYDGRYRLPGDIEDSKKTGIPSDLTHHTLPETAEKLAAFYDVSLKEYLAGQEWAENNYNSLLAFVKK